MLRLHEKFLRQLFFSRSIMFFFKYTGNWAKDFRVLVEIFSGVIKTIFNKSQLWCYGKVYRKKYCFSFLAHRTKISGPRLKRISVELSKLYSTCSNKYCREFFSIKNCASSDFFGSFVRTFLGNVVITALMFPSEHVADKCFFWEKNFFSSSPDIELEIFSILFEKLGHFDGRHFSGVVITAF